MKLTERKENSNMAKTYKVVKDHAELAEYKTLPAARKLADKQHGEVFCDGQKVYPANSGDPVTPTNLSIPEDDVVEDSSGENVDVSKPDTVADDAPESTGAIQQEEQNSTDAKAAESGRYRLNSLMNVRLQPSFQGDVVGLARPGTVVEVSGIQNDWLAVKNGTGTVYILYGNGHFATHIN